MGSVKVRAKPFAEFVIRDCYKIRDSVLPIFDKHTLLTSKEFRYLNFRKALLTHLDVNLSPQEKDSVLSALIHTCSGAMPSGFVSSA